MSAGDRSPNYGIVGNVKAKALAVGAGARANINESPVGHGGSPAQGTEKDRTPALPPGFEHLAPAVQQFQSDFAYDDSVFVMMKFPDPHRMNADDIALLESIWGEIDRVLNAYGLKARRADKKSYHDQLWENVCVHMMGSRYGIAVLEDRVAAELNPNVALEYGFMKALNRQVAMLREVRFNHDRADLTGKLTKPFEITADKRLHVESLRSAIQDWLLDLGIRQRQRL